MSLEPLLTLDTDVYRFINESLGTPWLDDFMRFASNPWPWLILGACFLGYSIWRRSPRLLTLCCALAMAAAASDTVCYHILKPLVARPRPCYALTGVRLVVDWCGGDLGFPSNHAANGMAMAIVFIWASMPGWATAAILMTLLVGFSRVYLGVHYPLDVIGAYFSGAVIGTGAYWLCQWAYQKLSERWSRSHPLY